MEKAFKVILIALVAILFTAILFFAANTIIKTPDAKCYEKYSYSPVCDANTTNETCIKTLKDQDTCNNQYWEQQQNDDKNRLLIIASVNIVILLLIIFLLGMETEEITLGLFFGAILSSIIAAVAYNMSTSILGLILFVVIFIECLIVIQRKWISGD